MDADRRSRNRENASFHEEQRLPYEGAHQQHHEGRRFSAGRGGEPPGLHVGDIQNQNQQGGSASAVDRLGSSIESEVLRGASSIFPAGANPNFFASQNFNPYADPTDRMATFGGAPDQRNLDALSRIRAGQHSNLVAAHMQDLQRFGGGIYPGMLQQYPPQNSSWLAEYLAMEALRQREVVLAASGLPFHSSPHGTSGQGLRIPPEPAVRGEGSRAPLYDENHPGTILPSSTAAAAVRNPFYLPPAVSRTEPEEEFPMFDTPSEPRLPPIDESNTPHFSERTFVPLAIEEDSNWLSERQCFLRAEILEVVRASHQEVQLRSSSKTISFSQVGIRCRFCAHLHPSGRAIRAAAYPSNIRQIYQSFTMMVRDHFGACSAIPADKKKRFLDYQEHKIPSSSLSREYWIYAAQKLGMADTDSSRIVVSEESLTAAREMLPFGTDEKYAASIQSAPVEPMVDEFDRKRITPFLFMLMSISQKCYLLESELVGKRKDASPGQPGMGCRLCCQQGRLGFCRAFPLNKRSLSTKVIDMYSHFMRCPLTPRPTKVLLRRRKREADYRSTTFQFSERDREFIEKLWNKLDCKKYAKA